MKMSSIRVGCTICAAGLLAGCGAAGSPAVVGDAAVDPDADSRLDGGASGDGQGDPGKGTVARVFATETIYASESLGGGASGVAGADAFCALAAAAGSLGGKWVAWLSTSTTNAIDHVTGDGPWYLVDRTTLAFPNKASLATTARVGIAMSELGLKGEATRQVWTGTANGGRASRATCSDWSVPDPRYTTNPSGTTGMAGQTAEWTDFSLAQCGTEHGLYCFEVP